MPVDAPAARAPWWSLLALPLLALGVWTLATDVPGWDALWYLFAWYSWLLIVDALVYARARRSWMAAQGRRLLVLAAWSVPFWYLYEAYNLRLENWYYVFALRDDRLQLLVSVLAFATVLPACLLHAELVAATGTFAGVRWRPLRVGRRLELALAALAVACIVAPLIWPRQAFALVWGATLFPCELVNWRRGGESLLRDLSQGRPRRLLDLLAGGMLAGLAWELFNFWARCKWIYTVPFFDRLKLFEMPLLGFLGFPVLSLGAFATWSLVEWALGPTAATGGRPRQQLRRGVAIAVWLVAALACWKVYQHALGHTVRSRRPLLQELAALGADDALRLAGAGISTPERLVRAVERQGVAGLAAAAHLPPALVAGAAAQSRLALHKGMGTRAAGQLAAVGVDDVATLGRRDPEQLAALLRALGDATGEDVPRLVEVRVWVEAARGRTRPRR
ncbi:MAG TPA: DUF4332 domain-containing protein [Thermoanaerobaculia bacterium]|nr:DUF4332 domain-containing protein [Thermoanaerobaculia bacterium]